MTHFASPEEAEASLSVGGGPETVWECDFSTLGAADWLAGGVKSITPTAGSNLVAVDWTVAGGAKSVDLGPNGTTGIDLQCTGASDTWFLAWNCPQLHAALIDLVPDYALGDVISVETEWVGDAPAANYQGSGVAILDGTDGYASMSIFNVGVKVWSKMWVGGSPYENKTEVPPGALDYLKLLLSGGGAVAGGGSGAAPAWGAEKWARASCVTAYPYTSPPAFDLATSRIYAVAATGNTANAWAPTLAKLSVKRFLGAP